MGTVALQDFLIIISKNMINRPLTLEKTFWISNTDQALRFARGNERSRKLFWQMNVDVKALEAWSVECIYLDYLQGRWACSLSSTIYSLISSIYSLISSIYGLIFSIYSFLYLIIYLSYSLYQSAFLFQYFPQKSSNLQPPASSFDC